MRLATPLLLVAVAACAAGAPSKTAAPDSGVDALIGDASCDSDSQCHTIAVGAKACGGPARYLAWSSRVTDGASLQRAADREMQAARARVEKSGVLSNCALVTDPGAYCAAPPVAATTSPGSSQTRRCQLRPAGGAGASRIY